MPPLREPVRRSFGRRVLQALQDDRAKVAASPAKLTMAKRVRGMLARVLGVEAALMAVAVVVAILQGLKSSYYFEEWQPVTYLSAAQILIVGVMSLRLFVLRRRQAATPEAHRLALLWLLMVPGFVFLAVDEVVQVHENLDHAVHWYFNMEETLISDRLDDMIVASYGLIGLGVLFHFRKEFAAFATVKPVLKLAIILFFGKVVADTLCNNWGVKAESFSHPSLMMNFAYLGLIIEDVLKVFCEGTMIVAFYAMAGSPAAGVKPAA